MGWAQPQELQALIKNSELVPNRASFHYPKIIMSQESYTTVATKMIRDNESTIVQDQPVPKVNYEG